MKKLVFILLVLVGGVGLWFYLLLAKNTREDTSTIVQEQKSPAAEDTPMGQSPKKDVPATTSPGAPPQTDVGMEFPVLEE